MYLTSLIHRNRLFELATRWMADQLDPDDGRFVTEVFIFERAIIAPTVLELLKDIQRVTNSGPIRLQRITIKDALRDAIQASNQEVGSRARTLFEQYRAHPEEFFPRTPVDMVVATRTDGSLFGMTRFKSIRRVAEKTSRRMADRLAGDIHFAACSLAEIRARSAGVPLQYLYSSPETMTDEFIAAEQIVSQRFRAPQIDLRPADMRIDDVVGLKFVGTHEELERIEEIIGGHQGATVAEREVHTGEYNDINLLVDLHLPPVGEIVDSLARRDWSAARDRGLDPATLRADLAEYVESGARTVRAEIILTTFEELVESEFGRAIHEQRTVLQRSQTPYAGRISKNAAYIIEYLLMLALSPTIRIQEIPFKMWGRYLPETLIASVWKLFGFDHCLGLVPPAIDDLAGDASLWRF